jgi:LysR family transcriptional regulator, glycine cleavage system transcriptional activator
MPRRLPPLNALLALDAVLRNSSVRKAALELGVTAAAVSQHIKHLETLLGTELFVRHPRGISLTLTAERLLPALARGFDALEEAVLPLTHPARSANVTISILPSLGRAWLLPLLPEVRRRLPHLDLTVRTDPTLADFNQEEVSLAIRYCRVPERGLVAQRLFGELVFPVCSPQLFHGAPALRQFSDLVHFPLLHDTDAARFGAPFDWDSWFSEVPLPTPHAAGLCFSDGSLLLDAAEASLGVALGRSPLVRSRLREGRLLCPFAIKKRPEPPFLVEGQVRSYSRVLAV